MRFVLDNNTPAWPVDVFRDHGHEAEFSRKWLTESAPNVAVLALAIDQQSMIVNAAARLAVAMLYVEFAYWRAAPPDHRVHIAISKDGVTIYENEGRNLAQQRRLGGGVQPP